MNTKEAEESDAEGTFIEVVRAFPANVQDSMGNSCTHAELQRYGVPLIEVLPELTQTYTEPEIILIGKKLARVLPRRDVEG